MKINRFKNAYGIKSLKLQGFDRLGDMCIYASNGTFKTSFSNAMYHLTLKDGQDQIRDRITNNIFEYDIDFKGIKYNNYEKRELNNVIVYSKEIFEHKSLSDNHGIGKMLVIPKRLEKIEEQFKIIEDIKTELLNYIKKLKIKNMSGIVEIKNVIKVDNNNDLEILIAFFNVLQNTEIIDTSFLELSKIDQKAYDIIDKDEFKTQVDIYLNVVSKEFSTQLFDKDFNDLNYLKFMEELENTKFINSYRGIIIGGEPFHDLKKFKAYIDTEIDKIKREPEVMNKYNNILKVLGTAKEASVIKKHIEDDAKMKVLSNGRDKIKLSTIKSCYSDHDLEKIIDKLSSCKVSISYQLKQASKESSLFESAIEIYKRRFLPKFDIRIKNIEFSKIGLEFPQIEFIHIDKEDVSLDEETIFKILSSGEKSAFKIIHFIVQYELLRDEKPLIILDDIVDTFDYANKYAFLMYINDLQENGSKVILLTHNFDFYRTVLSRTKLPAYVAVLNNKNEIIIEQNTKFHKIYANFESNIKDEFDLYALIPILRETLQAHPTISHSERSDIDFFTQLLHIKNGTQNIKVSEIINRVKKYIDHNKIRYIPTTPDVKYLDSIFNLQFRINSNLEMKKKLVLSMALRLKAEFKIINNDFNILNSISGNQTRKLYELRKNQVSPDFIPIYEKVLLVSPEFIHLNSFMYEPLIDVCPKQLTTLYERLKNTKAFN